MEFSFFQIIMLLYVATVATEAVIPYGEFYWKQTLPNSPIPKTLTDILHNTARPTSSIHPNQLLLFTTYGGLPTLFTTYAGVTGGRHVINSNTVDFFLEDDIHQEMTMNLVFYKTITRCSFLPRKVAEKIPFTSSKIPQILNQFSVKPHTREADMLNTTLQLCEQPGVKGEEKYCATSLEGMIDFSTSKLGKKVHAFSTEVLQKENTPSQKYIITGVTKMVAEKPVVCHMIKYAYAVFYCHKFNSRVKPYMVSLKGDDGAKVNAIAVCHLDTSAWNPNHLAFQLMKIKPGTLPVCHFLYDNTVLWVPY